MLERGGGGLVADELGLGVLPGGAVVDADLVVAAQAQTLVLEEVVLAAAGDGSAVVEAARACLLYTSGAADEL